MTSKLLIGIVTVIYGWIAVDLWWNGNNPLAIAYLGYAFANVGLWMAA